MTVQTLLLEQVGPFAGEESLDTIRYRTCDFCDLSATEDIYAGVLDESKWRTFYLMHPYGVTVCEHCLPGVEFPESTP